ncbi:hypothetical protein A3K64_00465 [Candidatus Micrarchaeota archaeon RBG_16_36_9]|nr:MAG: hypothetical protein A3K64_00465 [Candidatus Micrarchaeota archaeon RBG_16_36_9]
MGTFPISSSKATIVCREINRKKFSYAKKFLENLIDEKDSIKGKYFTKTSKEILKLLNQLESNAKALNVDTSTLNLFISAHRGATMFRGRRDRRHGVQLKSSHVQAVLSDKNGFRKKVR